MNFWDHWGWFEFLCYTGIMMLISSVFTALYMLRNQATLQDKQRKLNKAKIITVYRLKDKPWWHIRFHRPGKIPEAAERVFPPPHPGGRPVEDELDPFIIAKMSEGKSMDEAWNEAIQKSYPKSALEDQVYMRGEYRNMKKRIRSKYSKTR